MTSLTNEAAVNLAKQIAHHWGALRSDPILIRNRENIVFRAQFADGKDAALRLHRPGYQTKSGIEAELNWTSQLAARGFPCPTPYATTDGSFVVQTENAPMASLVSWIEADPIGENAVPFAGGSEALLETYFRVGRLLRDLHDTTRACDLSGLARPDWSQDGLLGETPHWGAFWDNPSLTDKERVFILKIRENAAQHFSSLPKSNLLIHADMLQENILQKSNQLYLIDFDDSGFGHPLYDLGTALVQHAELNELPDIINATSEGYGLTAIEAQQLAFFLMLRSMASAGWTISRYVETDSKHRFYAERMLRCAANWSGERAPN